jgi:DNA-binding MarR family transcriptional regulator
MIPIENYDEYNPSQYPLAALISIIYRTHNVYLNHVISNFNVTAGQIPFILHLLKKENVSQDDLANDLFIDKGTVAIALRKLEDEGIVKRKRLTENRRKYIISFTENGRKIAGEIEELNKKWENYVLKEVITVDKKIFMKMIQDLSFKSIKVMNKTLN